MSLSSDVTTHTTTVAVVTPQQIVAVGLRTMLSGRPGLCLVDPDADGDPDVLLYDAIGLVDGVTDELDHWVKESTSTVVALARTLRPDLGALALDRGAQAAVSMGATTSEIADVVLRAAAGTLEDSPVAAAAEADTRLGLEVGLSARENDVLRLVVLGLTNAQVAHELFLSINSVKTYIRSAYRKIGATSRPQAVAWCLRHGFPPPTV